MVDRINFSQDALELIKTHPSDGASMIATCRAIFTSDLDDEAYNSDLLNTFHLICDESDNIILTGFGRFNSIYKASVTKKLEQHTEEEKKIYGFYFTQFEQSISFFRKHYNI